MNWVLIFAIMCLWAATFIVLVLALSRMQWLNEELADLRDAEHAKCIGAVMAFVGDEFAANVLRVAAQDFDSVNEMTRLAQIRTQQFILDGPSVPALWLFDRANRLTEADEEMADA